MNISLNEQDLYLNKNGSKDLWKRKLGAKKQTKM